MADPLTVRLRLFAMQRELVGARELRLDLPSGAAIEDAWTELVRRFPILAPGRASVRFALNGEYGEPGDLLQDGDEIAVIPPVSGGAPEEGADEPAGVRRIELVADPIDDAFLAELRASVAEPRIGAVVTFVGVTRETPGTPAPGQEAEAQRHAGSAVLGLAYEAFEALALRVMGEIADEVATRHEVRRLAIVHRLGEVPVGEASVAIVAAAAHRAAAFDACRYAIDELKARAPIWKAEHFVDGSVWIGQTARPGPEVPDPPEEAP